MLESNLEIESKKGCKYFYSAFLKQQILVNSGYNCTHPEQQEKVKIEGQEIGNCYSWSCPLNAD